MTRTGKTRLLLLMVALGALAAPVPQADAMTCTRADGTPCPGTVYVRPQPRQAPPGSPWWGEPLPRPVDILTKVGGRVGG